MRIRLEARKDHLHVRADGAFDAEASRRFIDEMFAACAAHKLSRVLVDARELGADVGIAERFELGRALGERRAGAAVRIAIVVDPARLTTKTLEDSACNRGVPVITTAALDEAYGFLGVAPPG